MAQPHYRFYEAIRVFLACPGDLVAERSRFPRVLDSVNALRAHSMGFHLEAVGWERIVPSFGRPQELINRELLTADLTIVMFWNRFGFPSGAEGGITGTQEEFELAVQRYERAGTPSNPRANRPLLYVYFKEQTEADTEGAAKIRAFRKTIEEGRRLLYRQYTQADEWEELLTEHLVAFLNGRMRTDIETAVERLSPADAIMTGNFYWQAMYEVGTVLRIRFDFDGDDEDEDVTFRFQQTRHWLTFEKHSEGSEIVMQDDFVECLEASSRIHLAIKDVNNDGVPELLIAADRGDASVMLGVYGMSGGRFSEITVLPGQHRIYIFERGHIAMPYGSVGLSWYHTWKDGAFHTEELHDPLRRLSAF